MIEENIYYEDYKKEDLNSRSMASMKLYELYERDIPIQEYESTQPTVLPRNHLPHDGSAN